MSKLGMRIRPMFGMHLPDTPEEAGNLTFAFELMDEIETIIKKNGWTQRRREAVRELTQPRINDLLRGRISALSSMHWSISPQRWGARLLSGWMMRREW